MRLRGANYPRGFFAPLRMTASDRHENLCHGGRVPDGQNYFRFFANGSRVFRGVEPSACISFSKLER
jgi:hypothetical protein